MAKTLLDAVNDLLTNTRHISGTDGKLTSLTDAPRQVWIDGAVISIRDTVQEAYGHSREPLPKVMRTADIVLEADRRTYPLENEVIKLVWPLRDETNGEVILEHPRGYFGILEEQLEPAQFTGLPYQAALEPYRREIYMDRIPTATYAGRIYKARYQTRLTFGASGDVFPFNDDAVDAMVQSATERFRRRFQNAFDEGNYAEGMARAVSGITGCFARAKY